MRVSTFNRDSIVNKNKRAPEERVTGLDVFGVLDPGFEDIGISIQDYNVAPGLAGHFATMNAPPSDYFAMPLFERVGE